MSWRLTKRFCSAKAHLCLYREIIVSDWQVCAIQCKVHLPMRQSVLCDTTFGDDAVYAIIEAPDNVSVAAETSVEPKNRPG